MSKHTKGTRDATFIAKRDRRDRDHIETGVVKFYDGTRVPLALSLARTPRRPMCFCRGPPWRAGLTGNQLAAGTKIEFARVADRQGRADAAMRIRLV